MGFFDKLKNGLFKTKTAIVDKIENVFKSFAKVDEDLFEQVDLDKVKFDTFNPFFFFWPWQSLKKISKL